MCRRNVREAEEKFQMSTEKKTPLDLQEAWRELMVGRKKANSSPYPDSNVDEDTLEQPSPYQIVRDSTTSSAFEDDEY